MVDFFRSKLKGWRTWIVNILASLAPVLYLTEWRDVIPTEYWPYYALALAIINIYMRSITTTPVGVSEDRNGV